MKLTSTHLKQLIVEEMMRLSEVEPEENPQVQQPKVEPAGNPQAQQSAEKEKKTNSVTALGDEFIQLGKALKGNKVKGIDTTEAPLISSVLGLLLGMGAKGSAGTFLKRLEGLIAKQAK